MTIDDLKFCNRLSRSIESVSSVSPRKPREEIVSSQNARKDSSVFIDTSCTIICEIYPNLDLSFFLKKINNKMHVECRVTNKVYIQDYEKRYFTLSVMTSSYEHVMTERVK